MIRASIKSHRKPGLWTDGQRPLSRYASQEEARAIVGTLFGAIAESQNERYGDNHDAEDCARAGIELYKELCHKLMQGAMADVELKGLTQVEGAS